MGGEKIWTLHQGRGGNFGFWFIWNLQEKYRDTYKIVCVNKVICRICRPLPLTHKFWIFANKAIYDYQGRYQNILSPYSDVDRISIIMRFIYAIGFLAGPKPDTFIRNTGYMIRQINPSTPETHFWSLCIHVVDITFTAFPDLPVAKPGRLSLHLS